MTGGQHHTDNSGNLDTTELLTQGANAWLTSGALPGPRKGLKAARLNEKLILSGKSKSFSDVYLHLTLHRRPP